MTLHGKSGYKCAHAESPKYLALSLTNLLLCCCHISIRKIDSCAQLLRFSCKAREKAWFGITDSFSQLDSRWSILSETTSHLIDIENIEAHPVLLCYFVLIVCFFV